MTPTRPAMTIARSRFSRASSGDGIEALSFVLPRACQTAQQDAMVGEVGSTHHLLLSDREMRTVEYVVNTAEEVRWLALPTVSIQYVGKTV